MLLLLGWRRRGRGLVYLRRLSRRSLYERDELVEQLGQGVGPDSGVIVRPGRPVGDEFAAWTEFAQRLRGVVFVAEQLSSFVSIRESVVRVHRQMSVSANRSELPKQKPNKFRRRAIFF